MYQPQLILETNKWLAVNKPPGLNVEQLWDYPSLEGWVYRYLQERTGREKPYVGVVHRLDRVTSGIVLFARNKSTLRMLNQQFAARTVVKTYRAIVAKKLPVGQKGTLIHYLYKDQLAKRAIISSKPKAKYKRAELTYECKAVAAGKSELEIVPNTGRYHQIRVQLANMGWPIMGDTHYGGPAARLSTDRILLHANSLKFVNPQDDQLMEISAPPPLGEIGWAT